MTYGEMTKIISEKFEIPYTDFLSITNAVSEVFPMIVLANLSKNTYTMLRDHQFLCNEMPASGCYDNLIDDNMDNIHPNYQQHFYECFSREHLLRSFQQGKTEVYAEIYQKNHEGQYQWVSVHVIRIESKSGDVMQVCLNRGLDGISERRFEQK